MEGENAYHKIVEIIKLAMEQPQAIKDLDHVIFQQWSTISVNDFLAFLQPLQIQALLRPQERSLFATTDRKTFPNPSLEFIEMKEQEKKNLLLNYSFSTSSFGNILLASTTKGICFLSFYDANKEEILERLKSKFQDAYFENRTDSFQEKALKIIQNPLKVLPTLPIHIEGSEFQLSAWKALLKIPIGKLTTYGELANSIGKPKASRAIGTAIGKNPIAYLIPCHRVVQTSGKIGGYMWGSTRKRVLIGWELAETRND